MPRARRKPQPVPVDADYGTPERHRHGGVDLVAVKAGPGHHVTQAARVRRECWLDTYLERGVIDQGQHEAGLLVRKYHERARLLHTTLSIDYSRTIKGQTPETPLAVTLANERLAQLRNATTDDEFRTALGVCGHGESKSAAAGRAGPQPTMWLRQALDAARRVWRMR